MPSKTFHFDADLRDDLPDLLCHQCYLLLSIELLRCLVERGGRDELQHLAALPETSDTFIHLSEVVARLPWVPPAFRESGLR